MIEFTFAELNERAEGYKNYKRYILEYYDGLRASEPREKKEYHLRVIGEKFGLNYMSVYRIVRGQHKGAIKFKRVK